MWKKLKSILLILFVDYQILFYDVSTTTCIFTSDNVNKTVIHPNSPMARTPVIKLMGDLGSNPSLGKGMLYTMIFCHSENREF